MAFIDLRAAAQQALEAQKTLLSLVEDPCPYDAATTRAAARASITALEAALAEPVQEPVAYIHRQGRHWEASERPLTDDEKARGWTEEPLCTAPPQRPAEPVGVVTSMVKGGVTWWRWPADMPDGTLLFSEVQP